MGRSIETKADARGEATTMAILAFVRLFRRHFYDIRIATSDNTMHRLLRLGSLPPQDLVRSAEGTESTPVEGVFLGP